MSFYLKKDLRLSDHKSVFPIQETAKNVMYTSYPASNYDSNGVFFNCKPPKPGLLVDRMMFVQADITINIAYSLVEGGQYILTAGRCGFRSYPFLKSLADMKVNINGRGISLAIGEVLSALELYDIDVDDKRLVFSKCATYPANQSQQFKDLAGTNRSSFAAYSSSIDNTVTQPFPFFVTTNTQSAGPAAGPAECSLTFETCEPIWLSPFYAGDPNFDNSAIPGVTTLDFQFTFCSHPERRMFALDPASTNTDTSLDGVLTSSFSFVSAPKILIQYLEPKEPVPIVQKTPLTFVNPEPIYVRVDHGSAVAQNAEVVISSGAINVGTAPDLVYVFARRSNELMESSFFYPDCFFSIENLNVDVENRVDVFSGMTKQQMYDMSLRHGLNTEWASFAGKKYNAGTGAANFGTVAEQFSGTGAVVAFSLEDTGSELIPGTRVPFQFKVDATVKNIDKVDIQPTLYVVTFVNNVVQIHNGDSNSRAVTVNDLLSAEVIGENHYEREVFGLLKSIFRS